MKNKDDIPFIQAEFSQKASRDHQENDPAVVAYQRAIRALGLDEKEEKRFLDLMLLDTFRPQLEKRLKKTKLWHYAPEQREAVKSARKYLQDLLGVAVNF